MLNILAKTRSRMTMAITFSHQKDAGSHVSNTQYWEFLKVSITLYVVVKCQGVVWLYLK